MHDSHSTCTRNDNGARNISWLYNLAVTKQTVYSYIASYTYLGMYIATVAG